MKLLFDQNLSDQLVVLLADLFPNSSHVKTIELDKAIDSEIWDFARDNEYIIASKDSDFKNRSVIYGFPPKVIWISIGNCPTHVVERYLRKHYADIREFVLDANTGLFVLR